MKVYTHSFNPGSNSGPNKFTRQLFKCLSYKYNIVIVDNQEVADVEFCLIQQDRHKVKPMLLRLDGIWFNSEQNYNQQNAPIKFSYDNADAVIFQSEFNKNLTHHWFGEHKNGHVIHNAADMSMIRNANPNFYDKLFGENTEVWACASSWSGRPHKRLVENIRYFLEYAPKESILAIAGAIGMDDAKRLIPNNPRIVLLGELDYISLLALYKKASTFIHLAYLDHCPNVVVDAQAAGCNVICSSTGGTHEIVMSGKIISEPSWDYSPIELYRPPIMSFENCIEIYSHQSEDKKNNIEKCAEKYYNIMRGII